MGGRFGWACFDLLYLLIFLESYPQRFFGFHLEMNYKMCGVAVLRRMQSMRFVLTKYCLWNVCQK